MAHADRPGSNHVAGHPDADLQGADPRDQRGAAQISVDDSHAVTSYSNFCRVTGTPEELIVDFGLNAQSSPGPGQPIVITQRIVTNLYTAKRLLQVLEMTIQRHEAVFGALETDVQRRVTRV